MQIKNYNFGYLSNEKSHKNKRLALQAVTYQKYKSLSFGTEITLFDLDIWVGIRKGKESINRMRNLNFSVRVQTGSPSKTRTPYKSYKISPCLDFYHLLSMFSARTFTAPSPTDYFHRHCFPSMTYWAYP